MAGYSKSPEVCCDLVRYLDGTEFIEKNIRNVGPYRCDIYSAGFSGLGVLDNLDKSSGAPDGPPPEAVSVNSKTGAPALHLDRVLRGLEVNNDDRFDLDLT